MPTSKLKSICILILLLANLALGAVLLPEQAAKGREAAQLRQSISSLFANQDISLSPDCVPETVSLYALELAEAPQQSTAAAAVLLGEGLWVQDDSTRFRSVFRSNGGQCVMSRSGPFEAQLSPGLEAGRSIRRHASRVLEALGFTPQALDGPLPIPGGGSVVRASQTVLGVPVFAPGLRLFYQENRLTTLEGTFYTGSLLRISDQPCLSAADALVAFLSRRIDLGWVGEAVTGLEQGYLPADFASGSSVRLIPAWRLETDTGTFYVNGLTGAVSGAEDS